MPLDVVKTCVPCFKSFHVQKNKPKPHEPQYGKAIGLAVIVLITAVAIIAVTRKQKTIPVAIPTPVAATPPVTKTNSPETVVDGESATATNPSFRPALQGIARAHAAKARAAANK